VFEKEQKERDNENKLRQLQFRSFGLANYDFMQPDVQTPTRGSFAVSAYTPL